MNAGPGTVPRERVDLPRKPHALTPGCRLASFAPASPAEASKTKDGVAELRRLGYQVFVGDEYRAHGYFAGTSKERLTDFLRDLESDAVDALVAVRGGYGSNYLLENLHLLHPDLPKPVIGFSDLTSLQIYLWQTCQWVTFYGPMLGAGFDAGAEAACGYDEGSFRSALTTTTGGWKLSLRGESLVSGEAKGRLHGGCMTLLQTTIGTPWQLETQDAILLLEDRAMKPWQVDRALMHLKQAGTFNGVQGIVLGDFPECDPPVPGSPSVRDVCARILSPLGVPIVFGAPVGHTRRPMLTVPLGVGARLVAKGEGVLEILEPAVVA
jgi:muramoyltetrapeptide carboxypeptidase